MTARQDDQAATDVGKRIFQVGEVVRGVRSFLEEQFPAFWLEAEVSDARRSPNGHVYFVLNDESVRAQIPAVMWRSSASKLKVNIEDGVRLQFRGHLTLYEERGRFQFIARSAKHVGEGDLKAAFERVKKTLESEGLLDAERKRALPDYPRTVGVVTSLRGAALGDVLRVLERRFVPRVLVADCVVQGDRAADSVRAALRLMQREDVEVVIVTRGGGSAEDLAAFNDIELARDIAAYPVPVVAGVGHEVDVSILDLVADARAATPSNAAEMVAPPVEDVSHRLDVQRRALGSLMRSELRQKQLQHGDRMMRMRSPRVALNELRRDWARAVNRLERNMGAVLRDGRSELALLDRRLRAAHPSVDVAHRREAFVALQQRLLQGGGSAHSQRRHDLKWVRNRLLAGTRVSLARDKTRFATLLAALHAYSPLGVLERGYALVYDASGDLVTSGEKVTSGESIRVRFAEGELEALVSSSSAS